MPNTSSPASETIPDYLASSRATLDSLSADEIQTVILELQQAYSNGRQVLIVGNGGSAATASHLACDLAKNILGRPIDEQAKRFRVICLAENMSLITAWANDHSFDDIFAEQVKNLGQPDDLLVVITASGNSPNILAAVDVAKRIGLRSVGLLGFDGGQVMSRLDAHVLVKSDHYGHVEDVHMLLGHLMTEYFARLARSGVAT